MRAALILNPNAGKASREDPRGLRRRLRQHIEASGHTLVALRSRRPEDAARQAMASGVELLVVGGGDGTVHEVAQVAAGSSMLLAVVPLGTRNHFARDAGVPLELEAALAGLADPRLARVDVGELNGHVFLNNSSIGVYPRFVAEREGNGRHPIRWLRTLAGALRTWTREPDLRVRLNGREGLTPFVVVSNNRYETAGFVLGQRERLDAGRLALYSCQVTSRAQTLRLALRALVRGLRDEEDFVVREAASFRVQPPQRSVKVGLDGELVEFHGPLIHRIRPKALRLALPPEAPP